MTETAVYAAGGVVWRVVEDKLLVLLIHRTKYRDVTLPKGKVDPGEMLAETAAREIFEETGIRVALGIPVGVSRYRRPASGRRSSTTGRRRRRMPRSEHPPSSRTRRSRRSSGSPPRRPSRG
nr:hypothetical protein GCM10025699_36680 [Microbacterium flavescens]